MRVVRVEHVSKDYLLGGQKVQALRDITLSIEPGVFLAIAGPSGSGKTTLLNLIGCIDTPSSGKIFINDEDVSDRTPDQLADLRATDRQRKTDVPLPDYCDTHRSPSLYRRTPNLLPTVTVETALFASSRHELSCSKTAVRGIA